MAAGTLSFTDALYLVDARGRLMGELGEGEMEALPLGPEEAKALAEQHYCAVAACNLPIRRSLAVKQQTSISWSRLSPISLGKKVGKG